MDILIKNKEIFCVIPAQLRKEKDLFNIFKYLWFVSIQTRSFSEILKAILSIHRAQSGCLF